MTDRTVRYRLMADVSQFKAQMALAASSTIDAAGRLSTGMDKGATKASKALDGLGVNATTAGLAIGGAVVLASANFEQAMSNVQAATHGTAAEMGLLKDAALEAGATTAFSASEAAAGIENLAKAGISTADILDGGLSGALDLAAAGGMDVASAAEAAAGAMAQFKLEGSEATHVADLLAAGAGKAQGDVSDMVMALKQAGTVSAQTGLSLEETVGSLSALAEQSLLGSDAGTSFKTMLAALTPNSNKAAKAMEQYNIQAFDAQGNFVGMTALAGQLEAGLGHLTDEQRAVALETIFGSDAVRAASIIYDNGAEGVAGWTAAVDDAGYAAETAAIKTDNLKGDVEELKGALETAFIEQGEGSSGLLRTLTQLSTEAINLSTEVGNSEGALGAFAREAKSYAGGPLTFFGDKMLEIKTVYNGVFGETEKVVEVTDDVGAAQVEAANATAILTGAMERSAAEIEAEAEALKEARKAAHETAGGFVNLTDALNDSEVSLGDWITKMANQADALNNFTSNAKKAAKNGLRDGLIAALEDAGTEGALRMKQLANATDAEIDRANAAWKKGQGAIDRYVDATTKVPKNVSTTVDVDSRRALASFREVDQWMSGLNGSVATTYVNTVRTVTGPQGGAAFSQKAAGGPIYGPGTGTSDDVPIMASNGEYVIRTAAVNHYGVETFDRLNAMRFADGGKVGKGKRGLEQSGDGTFDLSWLIATTEAQLEAAAMQVRAANTAALAAKDQDDAADKALSAAQSLYDGVQSQVAGQFSIDPLAMPSGAWGQGGDPFASLQGVTDRANAFTGNSTALADRGLDGAALAYGMQSESNLGRLSAMSDADLQRFEEMYNAAVTAVGVAAQTGADLAYGQQVAQATAAAAGTEAQLQYANGALTAIQQTVGALESRLDEFAQQVGEAAASGITTGGNAVARRGNR